MPSMPRRLQEMFSCHTIGGGLRCGADLKDVTKRRENLDQEIHQFPAAFLLVILSPMNS